MSWITSFLPFLRSGVFPTMAWSTFSVNTWPSRLRRRPNATQAQDGVHSSLDFLPQGSGNGLLPKVHFRFQRGKNEGQSRCPTRAIAAPENRRIARTLGRNVWQFAPCKTSPGTTDSDSRLSSPGESARRHEAVDRTPS